MRLWLERATKDHSFSGPGELRENPHSYFKLFFAHLYIYIYILGSLPHVLVLLGGSGCAKSTLVELLCKDMGIQIIQWNSDMWESDSVAGFKAYSSNLSEPDNRAASNMRHSGERLSSIQTNLFTLQSTTSRGEQKVRALSFFIMTGTFNLITLSSG